MFVDGIVSDVTRQVEAEQQLAGAREQLDRLAAVNEFQALHDALTGLGNRRKLLLRLDEALADGRAVADGAVRPRRIQALQRHVRPPRGRRPARPARNPPARRDAARTRHFGFGGDEFLVLARAETDCEGLLERAARALSEDGDGFQITASFGAVFVPDETSDAGMALDICDQRLYNEKSRRSDRRGRPQDVLLEALTAREPSLELHSTDVANLAVAVGARLGLDGDVAIAPPAGCASA